MKKLIFLILGVLALVTAACSSDDIEPVAPENYVQSRSSAPSTLAVNENLLTNWENTQTVQILGPQGVTIKVVLPWQSGSNSGLKGDFATDIKEKDGWVMLFHTFKELDIDPNLNYMCFYNRFSGTMKIFYYSHYYDSGNQTVWDIRANNTNTPQPLFANYDYVSNSINGNIKYTVYSLILENEAADASTLRTGWNGFQFQVGDYQSKITNNDIMIAACNTLYSDLTLNGKTQSTTTGTITTLNGSTNILDTNEASKVALSAVGNKAENLAKTLATNLPKKNYLGINLVNVLNNVSSGNIVSAITNGLGFIFKSLVKPKTTVSEVSLTTKGEITMEGKGITHTVSSVSPITFDMNKVLTPSTSSTTESKLATLADATGSSISLGVWNLKKAPTLYYQRYTKVDNIAGIPGQEPTTFDVNGYVEQPECYVGDLEIEFNPKIKPYVTSTNIKTAILDINGGNRTVGTNGKKIDINLNNRIAQQENVTIYGITSGQIQSLAGFIPDTGGASVNENTELYYDWGTTVTGNRAVSVIVSWTVNYGGKTQTFTESRVYDVIYKPNPSSLSLSIVNNPPSTYLLNESNFIGYNGYRINQDEKFIIGSSPVADANGVGLPQ